MEQLGINGKLLLAQLINFGLFFLLFQKLIAKPFLELLANEKKKDEERQKAYDKALHQQEELKTIEKEMKDKVHAEMKKLMEKAKKDSEASRLQLIEDAKKTSESMIAEAAKRIEEEKKQTEAAMDKKIADLSIMMLEKSFPSLSDSTKKEITESILNSVEIKSN